ncbi:ScbA/BarX family gamma-butyrolactone biosynthesis protein [Streptomyces sp. NPDC024017]|uniref:ScbA/BarX family gamma-butyrolactone biosynthesis protein n=1 Tax=Streptomyces sp. NPDC024017 TaxID=3154326 RepID=UPI00340478E6
MHCVPSPAAPPDLHIPGPPGGALRYDRPVARESVHKSASTEVLLTDARHLGEDRFAVAARLPRGQFITADRPDEGTLDPVLLAETARQAAIHLSHRFHDIPLGHPFVLGEVAVELDEPLPPSSDATLLARCRRTTGNPRRACLELDATVWAAGRAAGRARVLWEAMEPRRYAVLRKRGAAQPPVVSGPAHAAAAGAASLPPARVGLWRDRDVLLASDVERSGRWWLRLDPGHPVLFDHPSDHIPGMALVEAFRQAAGVAATQGATGPARVRDIGELAVAYDSFGEPDLPVAISLEPRGAEAGEPHDEHAGLLRLTATQGDRTLARARIRCGTPGRAHRRTGAAC